MAEAQIQHDAVVAPGVETRSRRQDFLRTFFSNRLAMFGTALMTVFILMAIFAPLIAPYDPLQQDLAGKFAPPRDRKSTRLNSSLVAISYAVFCLKKKKNTGTDKQTKETKNQEENRMIRKLND